MTTTSPAPQPQRLAILKKFETLLDEIISVQREEQEAILNREVQRLPEFADHVLSLTTQLEKMQWEMAPVRDPIKGAGQDEEYLRKNCKEKFLLMQELAHQNHLLLENSMKFLARMMTEFVGAQRRQTVYNHAGALGNAFAQSGILVDLKV
jgi:hypothetical protein